MTDKTNFTPPTAPTIALFGLGYVGPPLIGEFDKSCKTIGIKRTVEWISTL